MLCRSAQAPKFPLWRLLRLSQFFAYPPSSAFLLVRAGAFGDFVAFKGFFRENAVPKSLYIYSIASFQQEDTEGSELSEHRFYIVIRGAGLIYGRCFRLVCR